MTVDLTRLVKPLVWEPIENDPSGYCWKAKKPFGSAYYIHMRADGLYSWLAGDSEDYGPLEAAQAAANADHAARVLASIDTALIEELVGAVEAYKAASVIELTIPTDRGGQWGPKGSAIARTLERKGEMFAALAKLKG